MKNRKTGWIEKLKHALPEGRILTSPEDRAAYAYDGTWGEAWPDAVVLARSTDDVSAVLRIADEERVPVVPRGAASGLSGGSVPEHGGIALSLTPMREIVEISPEDLVAVVQPGVVNLDLQKAAEPYGLFYPPDPASLDISTIGGNIAENAGGPRCLKYGVTSDYVLGLEVVIPGGEILRLGGRSIKNVTGYDLVHLFVGSEGTLGVVTEAILKLLPKPPARATVSAFFADLDVAAATVVKVVTSGILPLTTELLDRVSIGVVEDFLHLGLPRDAEAMLLIAVDGEPESVKRQASEVAEICRGQGATGVDLADTPEEEEKLWKARRSVSPALGRLRPHKLGEDIAVPRSKVPDMVRRVQEIGERWGLVIPVYGHIGDGNLHPTLACDRRDPEEMRRVQGAAEDIFKAAIELGGTLSGEHGIGMLKRDYMPLALPGNVIEKMKAIKQVFDPHGIMNPGKVFPG